jgi:hypothetical protein
MTFDAGKIGIRFGGMSTGVIIYAMASAPTGLLAGRIAIPVPNTFFDVLPDPATIPWQRD